MGNQKENEILVSVDYTKFKKYASNREVSDNNVKRLKSSISEHDLTMHFPILVNDRMEILDGQNRFEACKQLNKPIYYTIKKADVSDDESIVVLNNNQKNWNLDDYINHFKKKGVAVFAHFESFKSSRKYLSSAQAVALFSNSKSKIANIKKGHLTEDQLLVPVVDEIISMANALDDPESASSPTIKLRVGTKCFFGLLLALRQAQSLNFKTATKQHWAKHLQHATRNFHFDGEQYYMRWFIDQMKKHGVKFN